MKMRANEEESRVKTKEHPMQWISIFDDKSHQMQTTILTSEYYQECSQQKQLNASDFSRRNIQLECIGFFLQKVAT